VTAAIAGLVFVPLALAASKSKNRRSVGRFYHPCRRLGAVKFSPSHWLGRTTGGRLAYVLHCVCLRKRRAAAFVLLRRVKRSAIPLAGAALGFFILASFLSVACIAIPLAAMRFIEFAPQWSQ